MSRRNSRTATPDTTGIEAQRLQQQHEAAELAQLVLREKSDRLYVERLFALREEHHARSRLNQQEIHERELLSTAATFAYTLRLEADRHRSEMEALRTTLEKKNGIGSLQRDVRNGLYSLSAEQEALQQLATAAETHEGQMKHALSSEKIAFEGEKTQLLRRIGDLELAVQASRGENNAAAASSSSHNNNNNPSASEQERVALNAQRNAEEAWARAKAAQEGLEQTPPASYRNNNSGSTPPPEFKLTPLPASTVSLDAVEKARQRTTALLEQLQQ